MKLPGDSAYALCPACPEDSDVEGVATLTAEHDERGRSFALGSFTCPEGHTLRDLTSSQAKTIFTAVCEVLDERDAALMSLRDDQQFDGARDQ